jgi:hypothetical protein
MIKCERYLNFKFFFSINKLFLKKQSSNFESAFFRRLWNVANKKCEFENIHMFKCSESQDDISVLNCFIRTIS